MKKEINCRLCSKSLGKLKRFEEEKVITDHFKQQHSYQYQQIRKAFLEYKKLRESYKFNGVIS